jgi:hypothetical protein
MQNAILKQNIGSQMKAVSSKVCCISFAGCFHLTTDF